MLCVRLPVEQDHTPVMGIRIADQNERYFRSLLLIETTILHLTVQRIAHLVVAMAMPHAVLNPVLDASGRDQA